MDRRADFTLARAAALSENSLYSLGQLLAAKTRDSSGSTQRALADKARQPALACIRIWHSLATLPLTPSRVEH